MLNAKELGKPYDRSTFATRVKRAIDEIVCKQAATGIDVIGDGEHSKFNWMAYARTRMMASPRSIARFASVARHANRSSSPALMKT